MYDLSFRVDENNVKVSIKDDWTTLTLAKEKEENNWIDISF